MKINLAPNPFGKFTCSIYKAVFATYLKMTNNKVFSTIKNDHLPVFWAPFASIPRDVRISFHVSYHFVTS